MKLSIHPERRSREFIKHHVHGLPFEASFNEFTFADKGDPHDHPFDFVTHILSGGYTERVYSIADDGSFTFTDIVRKPGSSHFVKATDIHQIVHLPTGHCVTLMLPQSPHIRPVCFYRFEDGKAFRRIWRHRKFLPVGNDGRQV